MKIIFDIDGTMTDFHAYIKTYALPWFYKKYGLLPCKEHELELEDILDLQNVIQGQRKCTDSEAKVCCKKMIAHYWISPRFIRFSLLTRFRPGCASFVRKLKKLGFQIEIYTTRAYATKGNAIGWFARICTIGQLWLNGVFLCPSNIYFFPSDEVKLEKLIQSKPSLVFDDKPSILNELYRHNIPVVCIAGQHNEALQSVRGIERIAEYKNIQIEKLLKGVWGRNFPYLIRAAQSDQLWKRLLHFAPLCQLYFHPIVLNPSRQIITDEAVLYAPNHRSTLDPFAISTVIKENIHWAALLRFFQAEDSIFNNSKNPILCKLTAWLFRSLEYFPIDRKADNPNANNIHAIRDMVGFLRISQKIGIFGEGTIRRTEGADFGTFDDSIIELAKKTGAWLQPITVYWATIRKKKQIIINFGEAFKVENAKTAMEAFLKIQRQCLQENMIYAEKYLF